jgi:hypothetical protein
MVGAGEGRCLSDGISRLPCIEDTEFAVNRDVDVGRQSL